MVIANICNFRADDQKIDFFERSIFEIFLDFPIVVSKKYFFFFKFFFPGTKNFNKKKFFDFSKNPKKVRFEGQNLFISIY